MLKTKIAKMNLTTLHQITAYDNGVATYVFTNQKLSDYIKRTYYNYSYLYVFDDTANVTQISEDFCNAFNDQIHLMQDNINHLYKSFAAEYKPNENYDKYGEIISLDKHSDTTTTPSGSTTTTYSSTAYNNNTMKDTSKQTTGFDDMNTTTSRANNLSETIETGTHTGYSDTNKILEHTHGNIGVMDVPTMIYHELQVRFTNYIKKIIDTIISDLCVCVVCADEVKEIFYTPTDTDNSGNGGGGCDCDIDFVIDPEDIATQSDINAMMGGVFV